MNPIARLNLPGWAQRLVREPLVHFLLIGALIFGADAALTAVRGGERDIAVPQAVRNDARASFVAAAKREPTDAEMRQLMARWIDNEILYREGLALGLDKGDPAMRERVIFKSLNVVQAGVVLPRPDEAALETWFNAHRERYDIPARFTFDEAVPAADAPADSLRRFVAALNGDGTPELDSSLRVFKQRPRDTIVQAYGEPFAGQLEQLKPGTWSALAGTGGLRAVRLASVAEGHRATFGEVRDRVYQDWRDDTSARLTSQAVRELGHRYRIRTEGAS